MWLKCHHFSCELNLGQFFLPEVSVRNSRACISVFTELFFCGGKSRHIVTGLLEFKLPFKLSFIKLL